MDGIYSRVNGQYETFIFFNSDFDPESQKQAKATDSLSLASK